MSTVIPGSLKDRWFSVTLVVESTIAMVIGPVPSWASLTFSCINVSIVQFIDVQSIFINPEFIVRLVIGH